MWLKCSRARSLIRCLRIGEGFKMNSNSQQKDYLKHIDILIKKIPADCPNVNLEEVCHSSLTILENLYGKENVRITTLLENKKTKFDVNPGSDYVRSNF